jgi:SAM-dependent methyltransferase
MSPHQEVVQSCLVCGNNALRDIDLERALKKCDTCGYVFDSPRPSRDEIVAFYSRRGQYDQWVDDTAVRDALWQRRVRKMRRSRKPGSLLDVGAGIGQFLHHAGPFFSEVHGTEVSTAGIQVARERYGVELIQGQLDDLELQRTFDNVTMFHVLEHVPDPRATLVRCRDVLSDGGMLFLAVPNDVQSLRQRAKVRLGKLGVDRYARQGRLALPKISLDGAMQEIHLSHFTTKSLAYLLEHNGFDVVESSLDPYSVAQGKARAVDAALRAMTRVVQSVTGLNLYDTIWMAARRSGDRPQE